LTWRILFTCCPFNPLSLRIPPYIVQVMKKQVVKVICSKDLKFVHIDAGISEYGLPRIHTETSEEDLVQHYLQPAIDKEIRAKFPELRGAALTVKFTFV
jgi:hypothetical protein